MNRLARVSLLAGALALGALAPRAAAQEAPPVLQPEQRVRITVPHESGVRETAGSVAEVRADSVVLTINGMQETFALSSIQKLEVSEGAGSRRRYAALGGLIGAGTGVGVGLYLHNNSHERWITRYREICLNPADPNTCSQQAYTERTKIPLLSTVGVGVAGAALGVLAGAMLPGDRWRQVPLRVSATPRQTSVALSLSF